MPCFVIDISSKLDPNAILTIQDILNFEVKYGVISKNSCVMVYTGWSAFWNNPLKYHNNHAFPSVSIEAAEFLMHRGVFALGIDTLSADRPDNGFLVHKCFLGTGRILIENVAHLDQMPPYGAFIMALPLKIKNGTESPIRLVGLLSSRGYSA